MQYGDKINNLFSLNKGTIDGWTNHRTYDACVLSSAIFVRICIFFAQELHMSFICRLNPHCKPCFDVIPLVFFGTLRGLREFLWKLKL